MSIFDNTAAYGLMPKDEQEVPREWPHGAILYNGLFGWSDKDDNTAWHAGRVYRAKPAPVTKDSIDWTHVSDKFNVMARDESDFVYFYETRPVLGGINWRDGGDFSSANWFASYVRGTCGWRESLVMRPGYEEDE